MKKTLAAVAVLGAFAGSALAADVTLYGRIDTGFSYKHTDNDLKNGDNDQFGMETGQKSGSRFGFKGTEDLGNGLTVGFILENQFNSDTGALKDEDHFFRREASLFLEGGFGKVAFGRMGSVNGGTSSWGKIGALSAFGTSWDDYTAQLSTIMHTGSLMDNVISYTTPSFAGFKAFAQYSMDTNGTDDVNEENESTVDRYYAVGAEYNNGPLALYFAVDSTNYKSWEGSASNGVEDDSLTVTFGGNYDFEVAKVYAGVQYFDEVSTKSFGDFKYTGYTDNEAGGKSKGYAVTVSADAPVAGGKAMFGVGYYDAEAADSVTDNNGTDFDLTRWAVSAGYDYPLSKRTSVYGVATYMQDKYEAKVADAKEIKPSAYSVMFGLLHTF